MRLRRSRRRNLVLLSTRPVPPAVAGQNARLTRRRRFRFMRTGALLLVVGVMRLSQVGRSRWRIGLGLCGVLLEVLGHLVFTGPARGVADLLGLAVVLFAWLKSADPAQDRAVVQQAAWRWQG